MDTNWKHPTIGFHKEILGKSNELMLNTKSNFMETREK